MAAEPFPYAFALEAQLFRALILADRKESPAMDLRDCAWLLMSTGRTEAAKLLFGVAELYVGARPDDCLAGRARKPGRSTWDVAADELSDLISVAEETSRPAAAQDAIRLALEEWRHPPPVIRGETHRGAEPTALSSVITPSRAWLRARLGPSVRELLSFRELESCAPDLTLNTVGTKVLIEEARRWRPFDLATLPHDPSELATALAFNVMRRVLIQRGELSRPPYGDLALFQRSERLTTTGLGLGFQNLGVLAPAWPELELLIREAWRKLPRKRSLSSTVDRFTVLLSIGLPAPALRRLVDDLADAGYLQVLLGVLLRLLREPLDHVDHDVLRTVRDALLDLGSLQPGIAAQSRLAAATQHHPAETAALSELQVPFARRSGFSSTAAQRKRRFRHSSERSTEVYSS